MPTKIEDNLSTAEFEKFCAELMALKGKQRTLRGIQALAANYGITISHESARTFKNGPFARHLEKLNRGRETREALVAAARNGTHPLDALEEAAVIELQDHLTEAEKIDVSFVASQLVKLRSAISMREDSRRKDRDLERRLAESEKKIQVANRQIAVRDEQIDVLKTERKKREDALKAAAKKAKAVATKKNATPEELRSQVMDIADEVFGLRRK